jgi:hypothetical protein
VVQLLAVWFFLGRLQYSSFLVVCSMILSWSSNLQRICHSDVIHVPEHNQHDISSWRCYPELSWLQLCKLMPFFGSYFLWLHAGNVATMTRRPPLQRVISALHELMVRMRIRLAQIERTQTCALKAYFFVIPFSLLSVPVHSANCVKMYIVACRRVLSSSPL